MALSCAAVLIFAEDAPNLREVNLAVPEDAEGIIYFLLQLTPRDISIEFATALPAPAGNVFIRTLANVTRGSGADAVVQIRPRFFGVIQIPVEDIHNINLGLF